MQVIQGNKGGLIKAWIDGVGVEAQARAQLDNIASMPFVHKHVAIMPDVHWGMGATVGSVIPTKGAIIPAAVGVDIGCGMMAHRTSLDASDLPDSLTGIRSAIEAAIPHGRTNNGGPGDRGAWGNVPDKNVGRIKPHIDALKVLADKHPKIAQATGRAPMHAGTKRIGCG
jgi:tRNA-splicing ligase RtcB (3'-phosphate/5'-hydroxy nucleic acid ligase)